MDTIAPGINPEMPPLYLLRQLGVTNIKEQDFLNVVGVQITCEDAKPMTVDVQMVKEDWRYLRRFVWEDCWKEIEAMDESEKRGVEERESAGLRESLKSLYAGYGQDRRQYELAAKQLGRARRVKDPKVWMEQCLAYFDSQKKAE